MKEECLMISICVFIIIYFLYKHRDTFLTGYPDSATYSSPQAYKGFLPCGIGGCALIPDTKTGTKVGLPVSGSYLNPTDYVNLPCSSTFDPRTGLGSCMALPGQQKENPHLYTPYLGSWSNPIDYNNQSCKLNEGCGFI